MYLQSQNGLPLGLSESVKAKLLHSSVYQSWGNVPSHKTRLLIVAVDVTDEPVHPNGIRCAFQSTMQFRNVTGSFGDAGSISKVWVSIHSNAHVPVKIRPVGSSLVETLAPLGYSLRQVPHVRACPGRMAQWTGMGLRNKSKSIDTATDVHLERVDHHPRRRVG